MDSHGNGARTRLRHHPLVPSQYRHGGPWARGKRWYGLVVGRREKSILGLPLKIFWEKCPVVMTYHLKEGKMSWNHQVHVIGVSMREYPTLIRMGMLRKARKQNKTLLSGNGTWHSQHKLVVMAEQLTDQRMVWEGHPHQAKSSGGVKQ